MRRVNALTLEMVQLRAANFPALARLLQCGSLAKLVLLVENYLPAHELAAARAQLCDALRGSMSLTDLTISRGFFGDCYRPVLHALPQAPALHTLRLEPHPIVTALLACNEYLHIGSQLGALLAADPPRLRTLDVSNFLFNDNGMTAVLEGLEANTHLRELRYDNTVSEAFERERMQPALEALAARRAAHYAAMR